MFKRLLLGLILFSATLYAQYDSTITGWNAALVDYGGNDVARTNIIAWHDSLWWTTSGSINLYKMALGGSTTAQASGVDIFGGTGNDGNFGASSRTGGLFVWKDTLFSLSNNGNNSTGTFSYYTGDGVVRYLTSISTTYLYYPFVNNPAMRGDSIYTIGTSGGNVNYLSKYVWGGAWSFTALTLPGMTFMNNQFISNIVTYHDSLYVFTGRLNGPLSGYNDSTGWVTMWKYNEGGYAAGWDSVASWDSVHAAVYVYGDTTNKVNQGTTGKMIFQLYGANNAAENNGVWTYDGTSFVHIPSPRPATYRVYSVYPADDKLFISVGTGVDSSARIFRYSLTSNTYDNGYGNYLKTGVFSQVPNVAWAYNNGIYVGNYKDRYAVAGASAYSKLWFLDGYTTSSITYDGPTALEQILYDTVTVSWTASGVGDSVEVSISYDGGVSFTPVDTTVASSTSIVIESLETGYAAIKVKDIEAGVEDIGTHFDIVEPHILEFIEADSTGALTMDIIFKSKEVSLAKIFYTTYPLVDTTGGVDGWGGIDSTKWSEIVVVPIATTELDTTTYTWHIPAFVSGTPSFRIQELPVFYEPDSTISVTWSNFTMVPAGSGCYWYGWSGLSVRWYRDFTCGWVASNRTIQYGQSAVAMAGLNITASISVWTNVLYDINGINGVPSGAWPDSMLAKADWISSYNDDQTWPQTATVNGWLYTYSGYKLYAQDLHGVAYGGAQFTVRDFTLTNMAPSSSGTGLVAYGEWIGLFNPAPAIPDVYFTKAYYSSSPGGSYAPKVDFLYGASATGLGGNRILTGRTDYFRGISPKAKK